MRLVKQVTRGVFLKLASMVSGARLLRQCAGCPRGVSSCPPPACPGGLGVALPRGQTDRFAPEVGRQAPGVGPVEPAKRPTQEGWMQLLGAGDVAVCTQDIRFAYIASWLRKRIRVGGFTLSVLTVEGGQGSSFRFLGAIPKCRCKSLNLILRLVF